MNGKEYPWLKKENWGDGPWQSEPDRFEWVDKSTGYNCLVRRAMHTGAWCGYVFIPKGHPYYGKDGDNVSVHGGVTFSGALELRSVKIPFTKWVLFIERVWAIGFDCAHAGDFMPAIAAITNRPPYKCPMGLMDETYKTLDYVKAECENLAGQLKEKETTALFIMRKR